MNKPDWSNSPNWANYAAMDKDGQWCWYQFEPHKGESSWIMGGRHEFFETNSDTWKQTLEKRPENSK